MKTRNIQSFIEDLLKKEELVFPKKNLVDFLGKTDAAARNAIKRKIAEGKLLRLSHGYYLIIPPQHQNAGFVPPEEFISDLMKEMNLSYYVGLLCAAGFYGGTHQASQIFQVIIKNPMQSISLKKTRIDFFVNNRIDVLPVNLISSDRGDLRVSSLEVTCLDLLKYFKVCGDIHNVATVLREIMDGIRPNKLLSIADLYPLSVLQRLGYFCDLFDFKKLSSELKKYISSKDVNFYYPLRPPYSGRGGTKNEKWHLIINEKIEADV